MPRRAALAALQAMADASELAGDEALLRRFLAGEPAAARAVRGWALEIARFKPYGVPAHDHDEIVQQTLIGLWRAAGRPGFRLETGLRALTRTIAMARCVDHLRRRRRLEALDESLPDPAARPEERAESALRHERVSRALQRLDAACREIIQLHFFQQLTYGEIARRLSRAESTLRVRMFHCIRALRRELGASGG